MRYRIEKSSRQGKEVIEQGLPEERAVTIYLNGKELVTMAASPSYLKELGAGFLFSEGIIGDISEVVRLESDKDNNIWVETKADVPLEKARKRILTSGCGRGISLMLTQGKLKPLASGIRVDREKILANIKETLRQSEGHRQTGGTHTAAIFSDAGIITVKEDIGRHNCLDKAIGDLLLKGSLKKGIVLFSTGRISSEMALKGVRSGLPVVVSLSSPTDAAVELAEKYGLTIAGYARGGNMSIYTYKDRVF